MPRVIVLLFALAIPADGIVRDEYDLCEINHFWSSDDKPRKQFTQVIFWEWDCERSCWRVGDWRMLADVPWSLQRSGNDYVFRFLDQRRYIREVRTSHHHESWTQFDPEMDDRKSWPVCDRRKLTSPTKPNR